MIDIITEVTKEIRKVESHSYHHKNTRKSVIYPYVTFDLSGEKITNHVEGFYIDMDIIDSNDGYKNIFEIEGRMKRALDGSREFTDNLYVRFYYLRSNTIDMQSTLLKRRNLQFYCKIDRRN